MSQKFLALGRRQKVEPTTKMGNAGRYLGVMGLEWGRKQVVIREEMSSVSISSVKSTYESSK